MVTRVLPTVQCSTLGVSVSNSSREKDSHAMHHVMYPSGSPGIPRHTPGLPPMPGDSQVIPLCHRPLIPHPGPMALYFTNPLRIRESAQSVDEDEEHCFRPNVVKRNVGEK